MTDEGCTEVAAFGLAVLAAGCCCCVGQLGVPVEDEEEEGGCVEEREWGFFHVEEMAGHHWSCRRRSATRSASQGSASFLAGQCRLHPSWQDS